MAQFSFIFGPVPGPDFTHFGSVSESSFNPYSLDPGPDFINGESGSESGLHSGPDPDCIYFSPVSVPGFIEQVWNQFHVRARNNHFKSGPGSDFIKHVRVR